MSIHIIIDGYNLIRQSDRFSKYDIKDIRSGRDALLNSLVSYKKIKQHSITVVFDGSAYYGMYNHRDCIRGIRVIFSIGESADSVIKRIAFQEKERAVVVTSDREISDYVFSIGATAVSSGDFERKIISAPYSDEDKGISKIGDNSKTFSFRTQKKGPAKKLSKKERRMHIRLKKL